MNNEPTTGEIGIKLQYIQDSIEKLHHKVDSSIEFKNKSEDEIKKIPILERDIERAKGTIAFLKWIGLGGIVSIFLSIANTIK